jgi:phosphonate transport system permease protein
VSSGSIGVLTELEAAAPAVGVRGTVVPGSLRPRARHGWVAAAIMVLAWSLWDMGVVRRATVNPGGWSQVGSFFGAATHPDLSSAFLRRVGSACLVSAAYAVLATVLSVVFGLVGGVLASETWSSRSVVAGERRRGLLWLAVRAVIGFVRGIHEGIWGIFFVIVLGINPLVAILAIALPYGAITAKVYAEMIDESAQGVYRALRAGGASRLRALTYGVLPATMPDLVSYGFYRLECSIRAGVILGMIGAGGIGFEISQANQAGSTGFRQLWTLLFALLAMSALVDLWSARLRRRGSARRLLGTVLGAVALSMVAWWYLHVHVATLWSSRAREQLRFVSANAWPPRLGRGGWPGLLRATRDTFQMSVVAIVFAAGLGLLTAVVAARGRTGRRAAFLGWLARGVLLLSRAIPAPVWALLFLFVLYPGSFPGAIALGMYTYGVLARLMAEVVENLDPRPSATLVAAGANRPAAFLYATLPTAGARLTAYSLYRWEVAIRETIVVGVFGGAGLGLLLQRGQVAFNYRAMLGVVIVLIVLTLLVDGCSTLVRRSLR